jgi:MFS family permease
MFIYQSVTGFLPTYLVATKDVSTTFAAVLYGLFFASAIVFQFFSGILSDRAGQRVGLAVFIGISVPAFILVSMVTSPIGLILAVLLLGSVLGGFPPGHAYAMRSLPSNIQGSGYGLLRTVYIALGAGGPVVIGLFADHGMFDEAFVLLALVAFIASSISIVLLPQLE